MSPQTHNHGAGRGRLVEEIEMMLRKEFGWNEVVMSERMWRFIGVNTEELLNYGIDPNAWLQTLSNLSINDTYMLGAVHGDIYVRTMSTNWYEVSATTSSTTGVMYFERLMRTIKIPGIDISIRRRRKEGRRPNVIYVKFYVLLRRDEWPWHDEDYEIMKNFSTTELLRYIAGLTDTDGSIMIVKSREYSFEVSITSANIDFLKKLRDVIYERLGIIGHVFNDRGNGGKLRFERQEAVQLCELLRPYLSHPIRRLRTELYLMYYNGELAEKEFDRFYEPLEYDNNGDDPKRLRAVDMLTQAAPQTHTHGERFKTIKK